MYQVSSQENHIKQSEKGALPINERPLKIFNCIDKSD